MVSSVCELISYYDSHLEQRLLTLHTVTLIYCACVLIIAHQVSYL